MVQAGRPARRRKEKEILVTGGDLNTSGVGDLVVGVGECEPCGVIFAGAYGETSGSFVSVARGDFKLGCEVAPAVASFAVGSTLEAFGALDDTGLETHRGVELELDDNFTVGLKRATLLVEGTNFTAGAVAVVGTVASTTTAYTVVGGLTLDLFDAPNNHSFVVAGPGAGHGLFFVKLVVAGCAGSSCTSFTNFTTVGLRGGFVASFAVLATFGSLTGVGSGVTGLALGGVTVSVSKTSYTSAGCSVTFRACGVSTTVCIFGTLGRRLGYTVALRGVTSFVGSTVGVGGTRLGSLAETFCGINGGWDTLLGIGTVSGRGGVTVVVTGVGGGVTTGVTDVCTFGGVAFTTLGASFVTGVTGVTASEAVSGTVIVTLAAVTNFASSTVSIRGTSAGGGTLTLTTGRVTLLTGCGVTVSVRGTLGGTTATATSDGASKRDRYQGSHHNKKHARLNLSSHQSFSFTTKMGCSMASPLTKK